MDPKLAQLAYSTISTLRDSNKELDTKVAKLEEEIELIKVANELGFKIARVTDMQVEDLESKLSELYSKSFQELEVLEKAAELSLEAGSLDSLGMISDRPSDNGSLDPLTSFLLEDF